MNVLRATLAGMMIVASVANAQLPRAADLVLGPYLQPDGAITVFPDGATVEPYFATRALLAAHALGLNIQPAADGWITWQASHLDATHPFARYCRMPGGGFAVCGAADADDAAIAVWLQLLYATSGPSGLSTERRRYAADAGVALARLFDAPRGVYQVSPTLRVSLFMDNIEIASAFDAVASAQESAGMARAARAWRARSVALRRAIDRVFWDAAARGYRVTTQKIPLAPRAFYPDVVVEGYASFFGFGSPAEDPAAQFKRWISQHGNVWLGARDTEYPWGLIAVAAQQYSDRESVECWLGQAISLRHGGHWNVLEESVFQGLMAKIGTGGAVPPCRRVAAP